MKNLPASVQAQLRNIAREKEYDYNLLSVRYVQERILYRLSIGPHKERFTLKGGLWLTAMTDQFLRATRDLDLAAQAKHGVEEVTKLFIEAINVNAVDDGMRIDFDAVTAESIIEQKEYSGVRLRIPCYLGNQRERAQVDVAFGDRVLAPLRQFEYPTILDRFPPPIVRAYSKESVIAEKIEAIVNLGDINTRYKDFDDIAQMASRLDFDADSLWLAIAMTFEARGTDTVGMEAALRAEFATGAREAEWKAYRRRAKSEQASETLAEALATVRCFIEGAQRTARDGTTRLWDHTAMKWVSA